MDSVETVQVPFSLQTSMIQIENIECKRVNDWLNFECTFMWLQVHGLHEEFSWQILC